MKDTLEGKINGVIEEKMSNGTIEQLIGQEFDKCIQNALKDLFGNYGEVTKAIKNQLETILVPYLEKYDYSEYIIKLDSVLTEILQKTTLDNSKILKNFQSLMIPMEKEQVDLTDIFELWKEYVQENVDTCGLGIDYDDDISYNYFDVSLETSVEKTEKWHSLEYVSVNFLCEADENMNFNIRLHKFKNSELWSISNTDIVDITSLKYLNDMDLYILKLKQSNVKINLNTNGEEDSIRPNAEPEPRFE